MSVRVCLAVDEQNKQTLTFESENAQRDDDSDDDADDDDDVEADADEIPISAASLLSPAESSIPIVLTVSPAHVPSCSSGYASSVQGGLLTPDEPLTCSANIITSHAPLGIPTEPGGIPAQHIGISSSISGISSHLDVTSMESGGVTTELSGISGVPGISVRLDGTSMESSGVTTEPSGISGNTATDLSTVMSDVIPHSSSPQSQSLEEASSSVDVPRPSFPSSSSAAAAAAADSLNIPVIITDVHVDDTDISSSLAVTTSSITPLLSLPISRPMASLAVPPLRIPLDSASSDGESSFCSTAGNSTPEVSSPGIFTPEGSKSPLFVPRSMSVLLHVNDYY